MAQAEHIPVHVGALPWAVKAVVEFFGDDVHPGDVFLANDPYHGGSHLPDLTAFVPVFAQGKLVFWTVNRAHHSDIGGATYCAYNAAATEIWQEGLRVPPLRLYAGGELRQDLMQMLSVNVRHPRDFQGDLAAQIGSVRLGERRLETLMDEFGPDLVASAVDVILDAAEQQARAVLSDRRYQDAVDADWEKSHKLGVTGVPTFVANGQCLVGAQPYENLQQLMAAAGAERRGG